MFRLITNNQMLSLIPGAWNTAAGAQPEASVFDDLGMRRCNQLSLFRIYFWFLIWQMKFPFGFEVHNKMDQKDRKQRLWEVTAFIFAQ